MLLFKIRFKTSHCASLAGELEGLLLALLTLTSISLSIHMSSQPPG